MRFTTVLTSVVLFTSLVLGTCSQAKAADTNITTQRAVIEEDYQMYIKASGVANSDALFAKYTAERKLYLTGKTSSAVQTTDQSNSSEFTTQRAVIEEDYQMYIKASGVANSDALFAKYTAERKAFLAGKTATTVQAIVQSNGSVNEEMKIKSYSDYDYNLYVKATGGVSNDTVHIRFNKERNAYLGINTNTVVPKSTIVETKPAKVETVEEPEVLPTVSAPVVATPKVVPTPKPKVTNKVTKPSKVIVKPAATKSSVVKAKSNAKKSNGNIKMIKIIYFK
jgi:hypothetical protein